MTAAASLDRQRLRGIASGLGAAVLFGASIPLYKYLLPGTGALLLAGLLYLGAGCGLTLYRLLALRPPPEQREARLRHEDLGLIVVVLLLGGVLGPILMLLGLQHLSAVSGSLLLNLEAPLTILLAVAFFGEHLGRREAAAATLILSGAVLLGYQPGEFGGGWLGALSIAGACLAWALDNNLTGRLALRDPIAVTQMKTLGAGTVNLALALATGTALPGPGLLASAAMIGTVSYGASLVLHLHALRALGAARQAAYFATAPFAGATLSIVLLGERPTAADLLGALPIALGVLVLARAQHDHVHTHEALVHDHLHLHDEHHRHAHDDPVTEPHPHPHQHEPITHDHPHVSDTHHRHKH